MNPVFWGEPIALRILLVDDEAHALRRLGRFLSVRGHRVKTASNGLEALQRVEEDPPDLVLCDIHMPGMDGLAFLRAARTRFSKMPIVLMTGDRDLDKAISAFRIGARDYLKKPINLQELLACVADIAGDGDEGVNASSQ